MTLFADTNTDTKAPLLEAHVLYTLTLKELRDAWRNRWFLLYTGAFCLLALGMSWLSLAGAAGSGFAGLGRTAASLVHLVVLIVPLMGLTLGAGALAGERERGSLILLLAQPVSRIEVIFGKFLGLAAAVLSSLLLGFGLALLVIASGHREMAGDQLGGFLTFLGLSALVALVSVSLGLCISTLASRSAVAGGVSLFTWLLLVLLGDLGLMGTSLVLRLDARHLLWSALINPLQEFKVAAILALRGGLEVLGPAGLYASRTYGDALLPMLVTLLVLWVAAPLALSVWTLDRRGAQ
jgi:Cu-processing system permease protein